MKRILYLLLPILFLTLSLNSDAVLLHVKNISPDGPIAKDFEAFTETFNINSMTLYGNVSEELKTALAPFQIKTNYVSVIAGYSR